MAKRNATKKNASSEEPGPLLYSFLIILIALVALFESIFVIGPSYFGDDTVYLNLANSVFHGGFMQNAQIFSVRILNIYPIALFYLFGGVNNLTSAAWAISCFVGSIIVAFYLGKELYSKYAGFIAALLLSFFPLFNILSETPTPNVPGAFFTGLAMLLLILASRKKSARLYFATGAILVASILTTPLTGIMFGFVFIYLAVEFFRKKFVLDKTTINIVYGIILALVALCIFNLFNSGNPFITFTVTNDVYSTAGTPSEGILINQDLMYYFQAMFPYNVVSTVQSALSSGILNPLSIWDKVYFVSTNLGAFYYYAFVVCAIYLLLVRERRAYLPILWTILIFLFLEFGPIYISLDPFKYILSHRLERYLATLAIPLIVVIGIAVVRFAQSAKKNARAITYSLSTIFVLFLVLTAIPISLSWHNLVHYQTYDQQTIANYLNSLPSTTRVYLLSGYANTLEYMGYANLQRFYIYDQLNNCTEMIPNSYVLIPKFMQIFGRNYTPDPLPYCPSWQLVLYPQISGNYSNFVVHSSTPFGVKLYYIPSNSSTQNSTS